MGQDTYHELSRRSVKIIKNEGVSMSWNNSYLTVRTYKGLNFFNFSYNLNCLDKKIDCIESSMPPPKWSSTFHLFNSPLMKTALKNAHVTEMVLNSVFWPHSPQLVEEMTFVSAYQWSPRGFLRNDGFLAILNSIGGVEFAVQEDFKWICILDLSQYIKKMLKHNDFPKTFEQLKESVYTLASTAVCWASQINHDKSCFFVTAQKNGLIIIWRIDDDLKASIVAKIDSQTCDIEHVIWIPKSDNRMWLICTNIVGQIFAYECGIDTEKNEISLLQLYTLWQYRDRMNANNLKYTIIDNHVVLICSKHRHLLALALDDNCTIISQYLNNINDYRITSIIESIDGFYFSTVNLKIYGMDITLSDKKLSIDYKPIDIKESYPNHEIYSFSFSNNNMILALALVDRKIFCRKESLNVDIVFMSTQVKLESVIPKLLSSKSLTYAWDCVEVLRYISIKQKALPEFNCEELYSQAANDLHKHRIYLILVIIYNNLKQVMLRAESNLPEKSAPLIREKILFQHAVKLINNLYDTYKNDGCLSQFENESFNGAKKYLAYYANKYKEVISDIVNKKMSNMTTPSYKYECQSCDDVVMEVDFTCKSGHLNMFCSQTFTPILSDDYLTCKGCNFTVRSECGRKTLCVFCDLNLIDFHNFSE